MLILLVIGGIVLLIILAFWADARQKDRLYVEAKYPCPIQLAGKNDHQLSWEHLMFLIGQAKKSINVVCGNLFPAAWDKEVAGFLRERMDENPGLQVSLLVGPSITVTQGDDDHPIVQLALADKYQARITIRFLDTFPNDQFRLVDDRYLFIEDQGENEPPNQTHKITCYYPHATPDPNTVVEYKTKFAQLWLDCKQSQLSNLEEARARYQWVKPDETKRRVTFERARVG